MCISPISIHAAPHVREKSSLDVWLPTIVRVAAENKIFPLRWTAK